MTEIDAVRERTEWLVAEAARLEEVAEDLERRVAVVASENKELRRTLGAARHAALLEEHKRKRLVSAVEWLVEEGLFVADVYDGTVGSGCGCYAPVVMPKLVAEALERFYV